MSLPNFLIVGAAKSGTTSLYQYLRGHPDIFMPYLKEPGFLTTPEPYGRIETLDEYRRLFAKATSETAVGEASPIYLPDPNAPERIENVLGTETKILIILRNPIDAVHSLWGHRKRQKRETRTFRDAIQASIDRFEEAPIQEAVTALKQSASPYPYIYQMRYKAQVSRYLKRFPNCKVLLFENVFDDVERHYAQICQFLGVDPTFKPKMKQYNRSGETRSDLLHRLISNRNMLKDIIRRMTSLRFRKKVKKFVRFINTRPKDLGGLTNDERCWLVGFFNDDVQNLQSVLNVNVEEVWCDFQVR